MKKKHLEREPETEREYWATIESLKSFIFRTEECISNGRVAKTAEIEKDLEEKHALVERLVSDLDPRFGVLPDPEPPKGKMWYSDWHRRMKINHFNRAKPKK